MQRLDQLRILGSGGANRAMEAEVKRLIPRALTRAKPPTPTRADTQTLIYPFDEGLAWLAAGYLRTPSRALWDLVKLEAPRLEPLFDEVKRFVSTGKHDWLGPKLGCSVIVRDIGEFPAGPLQVRGTVKNGLIEGARSRGITLELEAEDAELVFVIRPDGEGLILSLDLAGVSLHQRGYRLDVSEAPLKETLAAQMLMLSRWDPRSEALIDPFAGSGTIVLEAALMAVGAPTFIAPRRPVCARWPMFAERAKAGFPDLFPGTEPTIVANDIHTPTVRALRDNAKRAGWEERIHILHGDFRDLSVERLRSVIPEDRFRGVVLCNPPFGERVEAKGRGSVDASAQDDEALRTMYADLVAWLNTLGDGWRAAFLSGNPLLPESFGGRPAIEKPMHHGTLKTRFLMYDPEHD